MDSSINWSAVAADAIVLLHFAFVLFVLLGGVLLIWWRKLVWLHLPAVIWGVVIEFAGWICPLTPYENSLRAQAGLEMYDGDFVMRYIMPVLYPEGGEEQLEEMISDDDAVEDAEEEQLAGSKWPEPIG